MRETLAPSEDRTSYLVEGAAVLAIGIGAIVMFLFFIGTFLAIFLTSNVVSFVKFIR